MRLFLVLLTFSYLPSFGKQVKKTGKLNTFISATKDTTANPQEAEKAETISLTDYGINAHIDIPIIDGYNPIISNVGKKKEKKILIVVSSAFRLNIVAEPTTFSDAEIYLENMKKADINLWFKNNPADPLPTMIINEPNSYLMQRGKEYKLAYIVTIDNVRYTFTSANYIVFDLNDALRYIRMAKTFFPK